ncbi:MAG: kynureninase [Bacteroidia bacterium]|nr:kynureninase [Bacteroidia bacterium]MCF8428399.1 kynureninase [Bacteroidia bacterium]MCF8447958.1 kynureninase [Bacteroidia bacterium]
MTFENSLAFAQNLDQTDKLAHFRDEFHLIQKDGKPMVYLCGNSLGLQPKRVKAAIDQELKDWAELGVEGHFDGKNPWMYYHHFLTEKAAKVVGAKNSEVVIMNNLTANLHLMMVSFYRPTASRYKIMMEVSAFPSDQYAMETQARFHGLNPDEAIIELKPREGEYTLRTEDILAKIEENKDTLAIVMMGGVNYYTGQAFDIKTIAATAHAVGARAGFDLAHAAGNLHLQLHDWNVDFAVWCTYKYLNSGPGGTSGVFVHERHGNNPEINRFAGWWGHDEKERFLMKKGFIPMEGAAGWQLSNAQIFPMAIHKASLELFDEAGIENLRKKSELLTGYLYFILKDFTEHLTVITPEDPAQRGCQLSIIVKQDGKKLFDYLQSQNILPDWREPDVIRMSPVPMYTNFEDVFKIGEALKNYFAS